VYTIWMLGPFGWVEREMCGDPDESLARLRSVPCLELDRGDDGSVLDVGITLLGASRLETQRGGSRLPSSNAHRCPRMFFRGAMHAIVGDSKMVSSWGRPSSTISLL
jgi:hypothetical protein